MSTKGEVFTTGQVAKICQVSSKLVCRWIDSELLPGFMVPGINRTAERRVIRQRLEEFLTAHGMGHRIEIIRKVAEGQTLDTAEAMVDRESPEWLSLNRLSRRVPARGNAKRNPNVDDSGFVYFFQLPAGPIKIGFSIDPVARLRKLSTGGPEVVELRCMGGMFGGRPHERALHERFAPHRLGGEWFRPVAEIILYIKDNAIPLQVLASDDEV